MPGCITDEINLVNGFNGISIISKDPVAPKSPKSTLSPESTRSEGGLPVDGVIDTSIEKLYANICEMQSSDQSPSRRSFGSDGEESRIDSELHHLVGGER